MKKLMRLLALALAVVMLLPVNALAAENEEPKDMMIQWLSWDDDPQPETEIHVNNDMNMTLYDELHVALYTNEEVPIPVEKLAVSKGLIVRPLCPGVKGKEHYARIFSPAEWNKEYTLSYEGCVLTIESRLPDLGLYSGPKATVENFIENQTLSFTPLSEDRSAYIICTATDETRGCHLVDLAFAEDADKDSFKLEKISDSVYKVTLTGSIDVDGYIPQMTVTWKNVSFMGGNTYSEGWEFRAWECASVLVSDSPTMKYNQMETPANYYNEKDNFTNELTLKAGESKTVYVAFTYFPGDPSYWIVRPTAAGGCVASDSALKLTADEEDPTKLTISCDVPGTYTMLIYDYTYPVFDAMYHADGTPYTVVELQQWDYDTPYYVDFDGGLVIVTDTDRENWTTASFEEAFPGEKAEYHIVNGDPWHPVTVTVEAAKPAFPDVAANAWYAPAVTFANSNGYMNGNTDGTFNPNGQIKGSEFAQILYNKEGKPAATEGAAFNGVTSQWYAPAILWAAGKGIVTDAGDAAVTPEANLTRQQIALMLYNYMGKPEDKGDLTAFTDAANVSAWAKDAMEWAVGAGVLKGSDNGGVLNLNPTGTATRAETAQILMNFFG